ncbi:MAG: S9 family peptidase [bacterium]
MGRIGHCILLSILSSIPIYPQKRAITFEDLWTMKRIGSFTLSPDGRRIAYTITQYNLETNAQNTDIFLMNSMGGSSRQLTTHPAYDGNPCWSPDGSLLAFISTREGSPQIYAIPSDGGEAQKISDIPTGVKDFIWSPDGKYFAFATEVYPQAASLDSSAQIAHKMRENQGTFRIIDGLFYRHWNEWRDGKRSHLYVMHATGGDPWDITPGDFDTPPVSLGSHRDFVFSPDGKEIAFVRNTDSLRALSTNNDIFVIPSGGGTIHSITSNPANDNQPVYSPDGKYIAYRAMRRPGFEADQYDLMLYDRKKKTMSNLTNEFDLDVGEIVWEPSSEKIYFSAADQGRIVIFSIEIKNSKIKGLIHDGCNTNLHIALDENRLYFRRSRIDLPHEIFSCDKKGEDIYQLTFVNQMRLNQLEMNFLEEFWFPSFDNKLVHGFLLKPPFFDPVKKYPAVLLIHGGPQGAWQDEFHYRWNAQLFASRGYIVILINCRGSKGYGQDFCLGVTKNWGGSPYRDLMSGIDYVLKKYTFINPQKLAAAGASFGGYMVNWIAGHTDRFNCLISHDGIADLASFYGTTEELWFPEWEFEGSPYENNRLYERWSPLRYAKNFATPTLVIHGEQDFRVTVDQGLQMFNALQRQNVPSKLLYFHDEGHFVLKPQNARIWWTTVLNWIDQWMDSKQ